MFAILNFFILFVIMHYFVVRQISRYTAYYWIERNLLLIALCNLSLSMYLYNNGLIKTTHADYLFYLIMLAFTLPVIFFNIYYSFMKRYSSIYTNGYERLISKNMFNY